MLFYMLKMFAGVPASLAAFTGAFAGVPASLAAFAGAFAGVPQVSRHLPGRLREFPLGPAAFTGDALTGCAGLILCAGFLIGVAVCIISFILICRIRIFIRVPSGAFLSDCEGKGRGAIKARQYVILRTYVC
ncbi:hypothetical protein BHU11_10510 [Tannerella sp. oral taxon 808]|nr:hypothetical protein BHU11_10510 [Tannerella sp. oral taxon 808]